MGSDISKITFNIRGELPSYDKKNKRKEQRRDGKRSKDQNSKKSEEDGLASLHDEYSSEEIFSFIKIINKSELYKMNQLTVKFVTGDHFVGVYSSDGKLVKEILAFQVKEMVDEIISENSQRGRLLNVSC